MLTLQERLDIVVLQDGIDTRIIETLDFGVSFLFRSSPSHKLCQKARCGMIENITVCHMMSGLVGFDNHFSHHE